MRGIAGRFFRAEDLMEGAVLVGSPAKFAQRRDGAAWDVSRGGEIVWVLAAIWRATRTGGCR